jgi:hypothetical protein
MGIVKVILGELMPSDYFYSSVKAFITGCFFSVFNISLFIFLLDGKIFCEKFQKTFF